MRSHHDMGGLPAGKCEPDEHEYELWEKRVDALMMLLSDAERRLLRVDELRRNIESLGADAYERMGYYERWMHAITQALPDALDMLTIGVEAGLAFESALVLGRKALETLGIESERAGAVIDFVRSRDQERLVLQQAGGEAAGIDLLRARMVQEPLSEPEREAKALNPEAEAIIESAAKGGAAQ
jgi:hypothetical protein